MKELSNDELKKIALDILCYIDEICKKNGLTYFLAYGTLLGAVRHKGYIPWDDDVDIMMKRADYEQFLKIVEKDGKYNSISMNTDKCYYNNFARVSDKNTFLILTDNPKINNLGVFVDVFPIDNIPDDDEEFNSWYNEYNKLHRKMIITIPKEAKYERKHFITNIRLLKRLPQRIIYGSKNFQLYQNRLLKHVTKYNNQKTKRVVGTCSPQDAKTIFMREDFDKSIKLEFEGKKFNAPANYDKVLTIMYGDYMELPPIEKRVSHHCFKAYYK